MNFKNFKKFMDIDDTEPVATASTFLNIPAGFLDDTWLVTYKECGSAYDPRTLIVRNLEKWVKDNSDYYVTYAVKLHDGFKTR